MFYKHKKAASVVVFQPAMSPVGRFCSLIPGLGVKLSNDHPLPGPLFSPR